MTEQWHVKEAMEAWSWVFDDNGKLVATAYQGYESLIAAAPYLLAACEAALSLTEWLLSEEAWNFGKDVARDVEEVKDHTTAAIAAARGHDTGGE